MANPFYVGAVPFGAQPCSVGQGVGNPGLPPPSFICPNTVAQPLGFNGKPPSENREEYNGVTFPAGCGAPMLNGMMGSDRTAMPWAPMMNPVMMPDPNMMTWGPWGPLGPVAGPDPDSFLPQAQREVIALKGAVLYPPLLNSFPPTYRERPPGCRTIFIGGLPETVTEDILREMFENCGNVVSVRPSKKNFAHIRFENQYSVKRALYFSGYRMKIEDKDDKPNTGRIHVDYAQARDDLYEYESMQRALERENRHRERMEEELLRPPSPPKVVQYSDHEALMLTDSLKADDTFMPGMHTLITWLDRGDCNRRTSNTFYSLLQSTHVHVRRLVNEKSQYLEELEQMKLRFHRRFETLINQLDQIDKVFTAACKQKAWDHFTKAQRKNIEAWRKQLQESKSQQEAEFFQNSGEAEMELSDGDEATDASVNRRKRPKMDTTGILSMESDSNFANQLRDENDVLKCQLEAYKNEVSLLKQEAQIASDSKDKQIKQLQMALQGMQEQLLNCSQRVQNSGSERKQDENDSPVIIEDSPRKPTAEVEVVASDGKASPVSCSPFNVDAASKPVSALSCNSVQNNKTSSEHSADDVATTDIDARLIALVTTFLHVHPFGASIDYIWSYLNRLDVKIRSSELEDLLEKYPTVFGHDDSAGSARRLGEKRWKFVGYEP